MSKVVPHNLLSILKKTFGNNTFSSAMVLQMVSLKRPYLTLKDIRKSLSLLAKQGKIKLRSNGIYFVAGCIMTNEKITHIDDITKDLKSLLQKKNDFMTIRDIAASLNYAESRIRLAITTLATLGIVTEKGFKPLRYCWDADQENRIMMNKRMMEQIIEKQKEEKELINAIAKLENELNDM